MVDYTYADLFKQDNVSKELVLDFQDFQITNNRLYLEAFELSESICSQKELRFGCCEASVLKFKCRNEFGELKNKRFDASMILSENAINPFKIGSYRVFTSEPSGDRLYTNVTAYDAMYDIINADMAAWYESLTFPITLKEFRNAFFAHFEITQEDVELIHDDMLIEKTISATSIPGKDIITAICELNGVFGHITRKGTFAYVSLPEKSGLYPSAVLYPGANLFPVSVSYNSGSSSEISKSRYIACEYEDFETRFISKLQIRQEENDIGVIVGDGTNTYIIEDNFLVYGKEPEELEEIANKTFNKIRMIQYRPASISLKGNPCLEVGDAVICHTRNKEVATYILQRTLKGIQSLRDEFDSEGVYEYAEKVNSSNRDVKKLKGKVNTLERTVEQTVSKIADVEKDVATTVTQTIAGLKIEIETAADDIGGLKDEVGKNTSDINKTAYEFGTEDLVVTKSGSEMETHISDDGMKVKKNGDDVLVADSKGVDATNLHAKTYLIIGKNSRFEDYGENRTGCFWIGG